MFGWRKKKKRICVIGLDGTPYSLLKRMVETGVMPGLGKIMEQGHLTKMTVSIPEISSVSWTTFMTGKNPGYHGIYGFTDFSEGTYQVTFPNFFDVQVPTIWDIMGRKKKMSIVINQPSTYPARKIPGVLVSGFVAIDLKKSVYPLSKLELLENSGYQVDIDTLECRENPDLLRKELIKTFGSRERITDYFWEKEDWDYFQVVITGTDRLQHFLWDAYVDSNHPYHQVFIGYYQRVDKFITKMFEKYTQVSGWSDPSNGFIMISDHGFTGIKQEVYLNAWLEKEGYLQWEKSPPEGYDLVVPGSKAFALDPGRIYIHTRNRFPKGEVQDNEKQDLMVELKGKLLQLQFNGEQVIRQVFFRDEIYDGPQMSKAPDLILLSHHGFDLKGSLKQVHVFGRTALQGMHTWDDAFLWSFYPVNPDLNIKDVAGMILEMME